LGVPEHERVEREAERAELVFLAVAVGLAQLAFVAVEDEPGDGVPALVAVEPDVTGTSQRRQRGHPAPDRRARPRLDARHDLPAATELVDDADRAGLQMAENGARAAGTPFISFYTPDEMLALARDAGFNGTRYVCGSVARRALLRQSDRRSSLVQRRASPGRDHLTDRAQRSTR
jgi:hypothetical protein